MFFVESFATVWDYQKFSLELWGVDFLDTVETAISIKSPWLFIAAIYCDAQNSCET